MKIDKTKKDDIKRVSVDNTRNLRHHNSFKKQQHERNNAASEKPKENRPAIKEH